MAIHNLLGTDPMDYHLAKMIMELKTRFCESGGQPEDFYDYLKEQGVKVIGPLVKIDDSLLLMAKLRFG